MGKTIIFLNGTNLQWHSFKILSKQLGFLIKDSKTYVFISHLFQYPTGRKVQEYIYEFMGLNIYQANRHRNNLRCVYVCMGWYVFPKSNDSPVAKNC